MLGDQNYNFTNKELKFSYWYITHKLLLRKIFIIFLGASCFLIWFYVIWQLAFFGFNYSLENQQIRKLVFGDNLGLPALGRLQPAPLQISDPLALKSEGQRYDYLAEILNSNKYFLATFDYQLAGGNQPATKRAGFILPLEKKYLLSLGVASSASALDISNLKWRRLYNPQAVYEERYRFKIENENFNASSQAGVPSILTFDITNDSAFSYWQIGLQSFLYSGGNLASVNYLVLEQLKSGEKRHLQLNWSNALPRISQIKIVPEVNVFDEDNIMPPESADTP